MDLSKILKIVLPITVGGLAIVVLFVGLHFGLGYDDAIEDGSAHGFLRCQHGWDLINGRCNDIDECTESQAEEPRDDFKHFCGRHSTCNNTEGSYECICHTGYVHVNILEISEKSPKKCRDQNECTETVHECHADATCHNSDGSYSCTCNVGYEDVNGDGRECLDIDECTIETDQCDESTTSCHNLIPRSDNALYECPCLDGFFKIFDTDKSCHDMNECSPIDATHDNHDCDTHATCDNTFGSFTCTCNDGWSGNGNKCDNDDECTTGDHECDTSSTTCENNTGDTKGYICTCKDGYEKRKPKDLFCIDIDECKDTTSVRCNTKIGKCINTQGSYECMCDDGFKTGEKQLQKNSDSSEFEYQDCIGINECSDLSAECDGTTTKCIDTDPGYECECLPGYWRVSDTKYNCVPKTCKNGMKYVLSEDDCKDIDECTEGSHNCQTDSTECLNFDPSNDKAGRLFECVCQEGFMKQYSDSKTECVRDLLEEKLIRIAQMQKDGYQSVLATGDANDGNIPDEDIANSYIIHYKILDPALKAAYVEYDAENICKIEQDKYEIIPIGLPNPKDKFENAQFYKILDNTDLTGIWLGHKAFNGKRQEMAASSNGDWNDNGLNDNALMCVFMDYADNKKNVCINAVMEIGHRQNCNSKKGKIALNIDGKTRGWIQPAVFLAGHTTVNGNTESYDYCLPRSYMLRENGAWKNIDLEAEGGVCVNEITVTDKSNSKKVEIIPYSEGYNPKKQPSGGPAHIFVMEQGPETCVGTSIRISSVDIQMRNTRAVTFCDQFRILVKGRGFKAYPITTGTTLYAKTFDPLDSSGIKLKRGTIEEARNLCDSYNKYFPRIPIYLPIPMNKVEFNALNQISDFFCSGCEPTIWTGFRRDGATDGSSAKWMADDWTELDETEWSMLTNGLSPQANDDDISVYFTEKGGLKIYSPHETGPTVQTSTIVCAFIDRPPPK